MTFYEAALRVLEREGKPLHVSVIVEIAQKDNLLSHVGKSPEEVMQSRLLAMARRRNERKVIATAPQTYGLADWGLAEDPAALVATEETKEKDEPPLRPRERHPQPSPEKARIAGRSDRLRTKSRRDEIEERKRRRKYPPLPEVAFELLSQASGPVSAVDLAANAREKDLVSEDLGTEALLNALREDNRRRTEAGRKPAFAILPSGEVSIIPTATVEPLPEPDSMASAIASAALVPVAENRLERGPGASRLVAQAAEHRRQIMRLLRRKLTDLDVTAFERAGMTLLEQNGFRDLRIAKRGKDGPLFMGRHRDGLAELRYAIQVIRGGIELGRDDIAALRREINHFGAQMGMLLSAAEVSRDARHDAQVPGQAPVVLWCGDALAEKFLAKQIGATCTTIEVWDLDDEYFRKNRDKPREDDRVRRRRDRSPERGGERAFGNSERAPVASNQAPEPSPAPPAPQLATESQSSNIRESRISQPTNIAQKTEAEAQPSTVPLVASVEPQPALVENRSSDNDTVRPLVETDCQRKADEERVRVEAHERVEEAELSARMKRLPTDHGA